jgi:hypothetical protein
MYRPLLVAATLVLACSRSGYDPTDVVLDQLCTTSGGFGSACDDACGCTGDLACTSGACAFAIDPCAGVTCSGHGVCAVADDVTRCACDAGYVAQGLTCVLIGCVPDAATTVMCDQGDLRRFDSCGADLGVVSDCAAGCGPESGGTCAGAATDGVCCYDAVCGDGQKTGNEVCDGADTPTCEELGYGPGTTSCLLCVSINYNGCANVCGNKILEPPEQCDGGLPGHVQYNCACGAPSCGANCRVVCPDPATCPPR